MSDVYSNQGPSSKATNGQETDSNREEIDLNRVAGRPEYHQQHEYNDSRYWHTVCHVRDCKIGFPEWKVGSSCYKAGWKNALEEPIRRSMSLARVSKRHELVAMLPSLLSNLSVSRTRSDPCIFGKDFLRITLPLPGEPSECGIKEHSIENLKCGTFENTGESVILVGSGIQEDNPVLEASTSPFISTCERIMPAHTNASSRSDSLFSSSVAHLQNDDDSIHNIIGTRIDDIMEHRIPSPDSVSFRNDMEISQDFGMIKAMVNLGDTCFYENAAANCAKDRVNNPSTISGTPQWDDWGIFGFNESNQRNKHSGRRRMPHRSKSKDHSLTSIEIDQVEEDGSDEGYLVLQEGKDQELGRFDDERGACNNSEEESISYAKQYINSDYVEEELFKGGMNAGNNSKRYKEDDIWSDEHFVSSQVKGFPPPISILANETHPGLPGHMPKTLWRSVKRDGRFVLQEVQAQPQEFFRATRECGRLRLQLVRPDSDSVGSYTAVGHDDSGGAVYVACTKSIDNLAEVLDITESNDSEIVHKGDMSGISTQRINALQPEDCWTAHTDEKSGVAREQDGPQLMGQLMLSTSLHKECGSLLEGETLGTCSGQNCTDMFGVRPSFYAGLKEVPDSTGRDFIIKGSSVTNHRQVPEELPGGKMALDEIVDIENRNHIITHESVFPDSTQEEVGKVSEVVMVCNKENPVGFSPSDVQVLQVGIPLDTGHQPPVGQIDGERTVEKIRVVNLGTKLDVKQVEEMEDLGVSNHSNDYQHPCFNSTYGFDNNLRPLSPSQAFLQLPIQPAVR